MGKVVARAVALACLIAGCGRFGYDLGTSSDDGGSGPADAATGDGSAAPPDGGASWTDGGVIEGCLVVTTAADEEDSGETPGPPHGGAGLSLREALLLANLAAGPDCIRFDGLGEIPVGAALPPADDPAGIDIDGGGAVHLVAGAVDQGLVLGGGPAAVRGLEVSGFTARCLHLTGPQGRLGPDLVLHDCGVGALLAGSGTELFQVIAHDNGDSAIDARGADDLTVRHGTFAFNGGAGVDARGGAGLTVINTILAENVGAGVAVDGLASVELIDHCDFFGDTCDGCEIGPSSTTQNPRFIDPGGPNFALKAGSPCSDRGIDTGLDVNGDQPGLFGGGAPDIGAIESN